MNKPKYQFLNSLAIKIIAIVSMTLDHIGLLLQRQNNEAIQVTGFVFRIFGRLSMPLIALCFAEAMRYSKDRGHYMSRLGLMTLIVLIVETILKYTVGNAFGGNIFLTLLCSASFIYFFEKENKKKYFYLIPLAIIFLSTASQIYAQFHQQQYLVFYPEYLTAQYSLYGFILCVGFYFLYKLSDKRVLSITEKQNRPIEELRNFPYYRSFTNLLWCGLLCVLTLLIFIFKSINIGLDIYNWSIQSYALLAIVPIVLYNGTKGYNSKVVQYGFYLYYPLHIIIIFLCFYLVFKTI